MQSSKVVVSWFVGWSLVAMVAGCGPGSIEDDERGCADVMADSEEVEYVTSEDLCAPGSFVDPDQDFPHLVDCNSWALFTAVGRFYSVCLGCGDLDFPEVCRPLVCEVDEDCPSYDSTGFEYDTTDVGDPEASSYRVEFECRGGVCQSADIDTYPPGELHPGDANVLCNAPLERGVAYDGPDPCPGVEPDGICPLPLPDVCLQPE